MSLFGLAGRLVRCAYLPKWEPLQLARIRGPRKIPHMPIKGPRDYDYWRRLKRKNPPKPSRPVPKIQPTPRRILKKPKKNVKVERETEKKKKK